MFDLPIYGLTQGTINNFREMIGYGFSHEAAMQSLKGIYQANKRFATKLPISEIYPSYAVIH